MSHSSSEELPSDIEEAAGNALLSVIPKKSKAVYDLAYEKFVTWCDEKKIKHVNEKVLLAYFEGKKDLKVSTLWTLYSMLRSELNLKRNIDIKKYTNLVAYIKRQADGYSAKKSKVFIKKDFAKFLLEADDKEYLMAKVAMIIGMAGACRKAELTFLPVENVIDEGSHFRVDIPPSKTKVIRQCAITTGDIENTNLVEILRKYIKLRPQILKHNRFFVKYANGKCTRNPVGINTFSSLPKVIAQFLGLSNPVLYTGHCFRRSSATFLADSGADLLKLKRHGGWKSSSVAEGYVENSMNNKKLIAQEIFGETSNAMCASSQITASSSNEKNMSSGINLNNCNNCVINIYNN